MEASQHQHRANQQDQGQRHLHEDSGAAESVARGVDICREPLSDACRLTRQARSAGAVAASADDDGRAQQRVPDDGGVNRDLVATGQRGGQARTKDLHDPRLPPGCPARRQPRASSTLSVTFWRSRRARVAPSAARTVSSPPREMVLASSKCATFAHEINSTAAATPASSSNGRRASPATTSCSDTAAMPTPALLAGCSAARPCARRSRSFAPPQFDAALPTGDDVEVILRTSHAVGPIADPQRRPDRRVVRRKGDAGRQHADDRVHRVAGNQRPPDHIGVPAEARAPERVADHRNGLTGRFILVRQERSSKGGLEAQHIEQRCRDAGARDEVLAFGPRELVGPVPPRRRPRRARTRASPNRGSSAARPALARPAAWSERAERAVPARRTAADARARRARRRRPPCSHQRPERSPASPPR